MIKLPEAPENYDPTHTALVQEELENESNYSLKTNTDNFIDTGSVCLQSPDGSWFKLNVSNGGVLSTTSVTTDSDGKPLQTTNPYVP